MVTRRLLSAHVLVGIEFAQARFQPTARSDAQIFIQRFAVWRGEIRQAVFAQFQRQITLLGNRHRVRQGHRQIGKTRLHLLLRQQILAGFKRTFAPRIGENITTRHAHPRLMRAVVCGIEKLNRVRRHQRGLRVRRQLRREQRLRL